MINAARDLSNEDRNIQFRIGLRTDAYFLYRTSDESTDKIESNVIRLQWTRHDILVVMATRIAKYFDPSFNPKSLENRRQSDIAQELHQVIESRFSVGRGHWDRAPIHVVLLTLVRNRPRDLIKLLTEAAKEAYRNGHGKISATDLERVFANYSHGRINDLILEFKSEMREIEQLLYGMRPTTGRKSSAKGRQFLYTNDELIVKLRNLMQNHNLSLSGGRAVNPKALAEFLYKIDFIVARNDDDGRREWTHFDQNRMLQSQFVDFGYKWEVHPAYRWAIAPKSENDIFDEIQHS